MSLNDDIMFRALNQLVAGLLRAVGLRKKEDLPAAEEALAEGLKSLGLTLDLAKTMQASMMRDLVKDPVRRALLGSTLCELAQIALQRGDEAAADRLDDAATELFMDVDVAQLPEQVRDVLPPDMRE